jgi:hypothetical protein
MIVTGTCFQYPTPTAYSHILITALSCLGNNKKIEERGDLGWAGNPAGG